MDQSQVVKFSDIAKFSNKQKIAALVADKHRFTLYGGAAGGGKSYWLRWYSIRWLIKTYAETKLEGLVAALFCENYPTLKDRHVGKLEIELPSWLGTLKDDKSYGLCVKLDPAFGSGVLLLRNLDDPSKYMSSEFALEAIDELTMNTEEVFSNLRARLRWPGLGDKTRFIAGTNPGNIGHEWVKKRWIDRVFPVNEKEADDFAYVPAKADDNPYIDPGYLLNLESLPERMAKALREGSWDITEGMFFTEFDKERHVVETTPYEEIPAHWPKIRMIDVSGRNGTTTCYWVAVDGDGTAWVYREYWMTGLDSDQHAENIWKMSHHQDYLTAQWSAEPYKYTVMDSAAWAKMGMRETTAEVYLRRWAELDFEHSIGGSDVLVPAEKQREMGWDMVQTYLRKDQLKVMDTCRNLVRTFPLLVVSKKNPNDVADMPGYDDGLDAIRYGIVTLRGQKVAGAESPVQRRLRELKEQEEKESYNYSRT